MKNYVSLKLAASVVLVAVATRSDAAAPKSAAEPLQKGKLCFGIHDDDSAIRVYTEAIRLDPRNAEAYGQRGRANFRKGDLEKAFVDGNEAIRLDPKLALGYMVRGLFYATKGSQDKAIADYTEAIRLDPKHPDAYCNRGIAYGERGDYGKAIADYSEAIRLDPKDADTYCGRGWNYASKGDYGKAIADYGEAIRLDPKNADTYCGRGWNYASKGDYGKAIADYSEAIRLDPKNINAYCSRGDAYYNKGDYEKAIADYGNAIRLGPKTVYAYRNRGWAYGSKGAYDKAIADFNEAIRLDPKDGHAHRGRGAAYASKGEYDKAIADYAAAIGLDPKDADAYGGRGWAYERKRANDKAIADYNEAIRLDPKDAGAYSNRGWTYADKGDYGKAIADLDAAIRLCPARPCYYEYRGAARLRRGDYEGGIADLHAAMRLAPNDRAATFEAWPKPPLAAAALQHGERQVRQMLRDRPAMARFGDKTRVLYQWAARKFAGEDLHEKVFWNGSDPPDFDSDNQYPTAGTPGYIRIRRTYSDGANKGKEQSFEKMWSVAVFELYNIANAHDFQRIGRQAAEGRLSKETYVAKIVECESRAAEKSRAFYIHIYLPWDKDQHVPTDPTLWYVAQRSDPGENLLLTGIDKRGKYWRNYEDYYDWYLLNPSPNAGEAEQARAFVARMQKQAAAHKKAAAGGIDQASADLGGPAPNAAGTPTLESGANAAVSAAPAPQTAPVAPILAGPVFYIITEGAGAGDSVRSVPCTGKETVLGAIAAVNGPSQVSGTKVWIARPLPGNGDKSTILAVDWEAVSKRGIDATNYTLRPGDRLVFGRDRLINRTNTNTKGRGKQP